MSRICVVRRTKNAAWIAKARRFAARLAWVSPFALGAVCGVAFSAKAIGSEPVDEKQVYFGSLQLESSVSSSASGASSVFSAFTFPGFEFLAPKGSGWAPRTVFFQSQQDGQQDAAIRFGVGSGSAVRPDSVDDLWRWMDRQRARGIDSLSIPSDPYVAANTDSWDKHDNAVRARNEPLARISEDDNSAREALKLGLLMQAQGRGNPYKLGLTGSIVTGIWAQENSRPAIYAALRRKESFATTGTAIRLRVHGGFRIPSNLHASSKKSALLRKRAVPMGGELGRGRGAITIVATVLQHDEAADAGVPADARYQLQVVKGWANAAMSFEKVFEMDTEQSASAVESLWRDPEFDPLLPAFYYVQATLGPDRAFASPIWYSP